MVCRDGARTVSTCFMRVRSDVLNGAIRQESEN